MLSVGQYIGTSFVRIKSRSVCLTGNAAKCRVLDGLMTIDIMMCIEHKSVDGASH